MVRASRRVPSDREGERPVVREGDRAGEGARARPVAVDCDGRVARRIDRRARPGRRCSARRSRRWPDRTRAAASGSTRSGARRRPPWRARPPVGRRSGWRPAGATTRSCTCSGHRSLSAEPEISDGCTSAGATLPARWLRGRGTRGPRRARRSPQVASRRRISRADPVQHERPRDETTRFAASANTPV